jgi:hypothetical protein
MERGRPTIFTNELADEICERIANGESLRAICREDGKPALSTVFRWLSNDRAFQDQYAMARDEQAEAFADELVSISDEQEYEKVEIDGVPLAVKFDSTAVARNRLRIDARKWVASKLKPKKYGDRQVIAGDPEAPILSVSDAQLDARLMALIAQAEKDNG